MSTETATLNPEETASGPVGVNGGASKTSSSASNAAMEALKASRDKAIHAAEEFKSAAEAKAREWGSAVDQKTGELKQKAEVAYQDARERFRDIQHESEVYIRENPLKAVLIAAGAGFVLGLLARK